MKLVDQVWQQRTDDKIWSNEHLLEHLWGTAGDSSKHQGWGPIGMRARIIIEAQILGDMK